MRPGRVPFQDAGVIGSPPTAGFDEPKHARLAEGLAHRRPDLMAPPTFDVGVPDAVADEEPLLKASEIARVHGD